MGRRHKPEEIIGKLREAEIVLAQGGTTADACRRIAVAEQTCQRWRKDYGGPKTDQARRMKDPEKDNLRLRRAISDPTLDKPILQEASRGNFRARRGEGAASIIYAASWQYPNDGSCIRLRPEYPGYVWAYELGALRLPFSASLRIRRGSHP